MAVVCLADHSGFRQGTASALPQLKPNQLGFIGFLPRPVGLRSRFGMRGRDA
jgi:hypothetical protein